MSYLEELREFYPLDLYAFSRGLTEGEFTVLKNLRKVLEEKVKPVVNEHWEKAEFPFEAFGEIAKVGVMNSPLLFEGREDKRKPSELYNAFLYLELAKLDASIATFYTVHGGLCYNTILMGGSEEQIAHYAPKVASFEWQGCFGLTEPDHGSDIAGGLATTGSEGLRVDVIQNKVALREVQNGHIYLNDVEVDDSTRLANVNGFKDVARILRATRADIAHLAMGMTYGSLEAALKYVKERDQFGKKVSSFQLVQEKLARMEANVVATMAYSVQLANLQEQGEFLEENSALAKMHNALRMRETVALGREVCGGNGITLETDVARFFADGEAIYSYEGTHEINALIVGRYLTGQGAFV